MIAGRYRLEREIGRGGAGVVHLAHDELLDRPVAVKRIGLLPGTTDDDVVRAQREARLAAGINHPHVVSIFDLVKDEDCYWLVMEHVDGRTLAELVASEGPLPDRRAAAILAQAADALLEAGSAGIVHRDVKPSNIILTGADRAKLGDFGIARSASDTALTQTGLITGSPAYIAPEVASGQPASEASDVWSLGATLYHAVVGRPPYDVGDNVLGGLYRIVNEDPPRLTGDHAVAGLLSVMMVKDPAQRWPVARVRDDLRRIARGEPSTAPLPATPVPVSEQTDPDATVAMAAPTGTSGPGSARGDATRTTPTTPAQAAAASTPVTDHDPPPPQGPTPTPPPATTPAGSRGRSAGWLAAALALALVAGLGAWLLWPRDEDPTGSTAGDDAPGASADPSSEEPSDSTSEPTSEPTSDPTSQPTESPTESPSEETTTDPGASGATPAAARAFVRDYFAQVTSDPASTFELLTPEFQAASGGLGSYTGFWSTIESATPRAVRVDPQTLTASYTIDFVTTSGRTMTEQGRLQLEEQGDQLLIAGEG
ncbi:protein kinase domain-containing protein [Nocardioides sp. zg-1228]|uniref:protein kinase domain-containing protein n=1 Tax=Nocardioides sp. zg-1228 TaxID=2763008 RepID=UPI001642DA28|nr:protein kinase [Nocardioides sp. zg-1228]MBC2934221.1 protein kinase [Nocardioides sp. zg-1228]QSF58965.1 protein kinase [Nocardioides sp. zg-1228]